MDIEAIKAEISDLLATMENQPEDLHELQLKVHEKLNEIRAFGLPIPEDLQELEKKLAASLKEQ